MSMADGDPVYVAPEDGWDSGYWGVVKEDSTVYTAPIEVEEGG
jgi:hypothetical protein